MTNRLINITRRCLFVVAAVSTLAASAHAQDMKIRSIIHYTVKPDRTGDFEGALKEYNGVLRKAGWQKNATWWLSLSGKREYILVRYHEKYAEFDTSQDPALKEVRPELTRISARMMNCVESMERVIDEVQPELSLPRSKEIPPMISLLRVRVRPERVNDYIAAIKSDFMPAMKKSDIKAFVTARVRYGASRMEFRSSLGLKDWADLDSPSDVVKAMGAEAYQRYLAKINPMLTSVELNLARFSTELSYIAAQK